MKRLTFLERTEELVVYANRYETVTVFEICQLYSASLCAFLAFLLTLPLFIFSSLWIALPLCFCILALSILLLFNERLWLTDSLKSYKIASGTVIKTAAYIMSCFEGIKKWIPEAPFYEEFSGVFRKINPLVLIFAAFQVGFIQSPDTSSFTVFSLALVSLGSVADNGYLCLVGYAAFLIGLA